MACLAVGGTGLRTPGTGLPFCRQQKSVPAEAVGHESEDCFDYSPNNPKSTSGSAYWVPGRAARRPMAEEPGSVGTNAVQPFLRFEGRHTGIARPSNVIE